MIDHMTAMEICKVVFFYHDGAILKTRRGARGGHPPAALGVQISPNVPRAVT